MRLSPQSTVRFAAFLGDNAANFYGDVVDLLGRSTGLKTSMVAPAASGFETQLAAAEIDCAFVCGLPYVLWQASHARPQLELLAAPVMAGRRYADEPIYYSDLIVRRDAQIESWRDLRGLRLVINETASCSGYVLPRYEFMRRGVDLDFFAEIVASGSHAASMDAVESGTADAAAIDSVVLEMEYQQRPQRRDVFRTIASFGPAGMPPVVATRRMPQRVRAALSSALIDLDSSAAGAALLRQGGVRRFSAVDDSNYDDIRRIVRTLESRPSAHLVQ